MNNTHLILNEIKLIREKNEKVANDNFDRALNNKEFKEVYLTIKDLNFLIAKLDFEGKDHKKEDELLKEKNQVAGKILKKMGLTFDDFKPKYDCKICGDLGFVNGKYCSCFYKKLNSQVVNNIGLNVDKFHNFENSNFSLFDDSEKIKNMYQKIEKWCDNSSKYKNILLCGQTGVGKTFLVECICNKLMSQNKLVNFFSAFALNNLFLKFHTTFDETKNSMLDGVLNCNVLIIDDLGSEPKFKNVTEEYFYLIINERLVKNKSTIITTNLSPNQIRDKYGERVFSRICNKENSLLIKIENNDLRLKKR